MPVDPLTYIVESQSPWMVLCVALVLYIVKLQNDKLKDLCCAVSNVALALASHDTQAKDIKGDTEFIRNWCSGKTCVKKED